MIVYNVTIKVNPDIQKEWLVWMKEVHIPNVMKTGIFVEYRVTKVLDLDETDGVTFAVQYLCNTITEYEAYRDQFAPALQQEHTEKYGDRFVAFRTLLEVVG